MPVLGIPISIMLLSILIQCRLIDALPQRYQGRASHIFLHAIATKNKFSVERPKIDRDSVDANVHAKGKLDKDSILNSPQIDIQLKATTQKYDGDQIAFPLPIKNYNELCAYTCVPRILVVVLLPENEEEWLCLTPEELIIKGEAYWKNLRGRDQSENASNKTIYIPKNNRFTAISLKKLMITVSMRREISDET